MIARDGCRQIPLQEILECLTRLIHFFIATQSPATTARRRGIHLGVKSHPMWSLLF